MVVMLVLLPEDRANYVAADHEKDIDAQEAVFLQKSDSGRDFAFKSGVSH